MAAGLRSLFFSVHSLAQCLLLTKNTSLEKWKKKRKNPKSREQRWKILPLAPQVLGPGESGCATRAEVALVVMWGLEGTRVTEEWDGFVPSLALLLPSPCLGSAA